MDTLARFLMGCMLFTTTMAAIPTTTTTLSSSLPTSRPASSLGRSRTSSQLSLTEQDIKAHFPIGFIPGTTTPMGRCGTRNVTPNDLKMEEMIEKLMKHCKEQASAEHKHHEERRLFRRINRPTSNVKSQPSSKVNHQSSIPSLQSNTHPSSISCPARNQGEISIHYIVVSDGSRGILSPTQLNQQTQLIQKDLNSFGFHFKLGTIQSVANSDWYKHASQGSSHEVAMKKLGHRHVNALNIYIVGPDIPLSYASYPSDLKTRPHLDGIVIPNTALGKPLVLHEIGHWLGLYHETPRIRFRRPSLQGELVRFAPGTKPPHADGLSSDECTSGETGTLGNGMSETWRCYSSFSWTQKQIEKVQIGFAMREHFYQE